MKLVSYTVYPGRLLDGAKPYTLPSCGVTFQPMPNASEQDLVEVIGELQNALAEMRQNASELRTASIQGK